MIDCKRAAGHLVSIIAVGLLLSGCGGGGSEDATGGVVSAPAPVGAGSTVVTGAASKGPIAGATVSLFEFDAFGNPASTPAVTTTTDASGNFSVTLPAESASAFLVETSGGSFVDESDQEANVELKRRIQLGQGEGLRSVIAQGQTSVAITPYTDALVERARLEGSVNGDFVARLDTLRALLADQVGFDVVTTIPANPVSPASTATAAQMQYALLLGAIANVINNVSIQLGLPAPDFEVIRAVIADLSDGQIDGNRFNARVEVYLDDSVRDLPNNVDFDLELNRFRNNNFVSFEATPLPVINPGELANIAPFARAGADQVLRQGSSVQLDGAESVDLDGGIATYSWVQTSGPAVELSGSATATPGFTLPGSFVDTLTLVFQLTVTDASGATASDSVTVVAEPALPRRVFVVDELDEPFQFGRDLEPGGGLLTFNADGTGTLIDEDGSTVFDWSAVGLVATIDFSRIGGYIVDEYTTFSLQDQLGRQDELRVTETINSFVITVTEDNPVRDLLTIREIGTRTTVNVTQETSAESEAIDDTDPIVAYDLALAQSPFVIPVGQVRSLLTNVSSAIPTLEDAPVLALDRVTFGAEGSGTAFEKDESFTWSIQSDGHLRITFAGGDVGDYYLLNTRPSGDVIAVEYTYADGVKRIGAELSFVKDPDDNWDSESLSGAYLSRGSTELEDGTRVSDNVSYRLNPDGTGLLEFDFIDTATGARTPTNSRFGICWHVANDELVIERINAPDQLFEGSVQPDEFYCEELFTDEIRFQRDHYLYDIASDGTLFKTVVRQRDNDCTSPGDEECGLPVTQFFPRIFSKTDSFSNNPPVTVPDFALTTVGTPVQINVLDNDYDDREAIDDRTVELVVTPQGGSVSVDPETGVVTFTPDSSGQPGLFFYRVSDLDENRSSYARVDVAVDPPTAIAADLEVEQGTNVTLDATGSTDNSTITAYRWTQVDGTPVGLSDPESATPGFTSPILGDLLDAETLVFELEVTDDTGQSDLTEVYVDLVPRFATEFVLVDDLPLEQRDPLAFFGSELLDTGDFVTLNPDGTGTLIAPDGSVDFDWFIEGDELALDFSPYGGFIPDIFTDFRDIDGDEIDEQIEETTVTDLVQFTLIENGAGVDLVDVRIFDTVTIYNVTDNLLVSEEEEIEEFTTRIFEADLQIPFVINDGDGRALVTNSSTANPDLRNAPEAEVDELTFDANGTGYARFKEQTFDWSIEEDGHLRVQFADGEVADYYHRKETRAGDFVTSLYHYTDGTTGAFANLMFRDNLDFDTGSVPGIYLQYNPVLLDDGSVYYERAWRSARPDGTGQGEFESIDPTTGEISIASSSRGICWSLESGDDLFFKRTPSFGQRYPGSRTPDPSTCDGLSDFDVEFGRIYNLYDALPETVSRYGVEAEQLQIVARNVVNTDCDCSDPLSVDSNFPVIFEFIPFNGNPGFAVNDDVDVDQGVPTVIDILSNDIDGDFAIDPTSIVIELEPAHGTVTVDPVTGDLTYTSDLAFAPDLTGSSQLSSANALTLSSDLFSFSDVIYYRFKDVNGNLSSLGTINISIEQGLPVAVADVDVSAEQGDTVTLDGSGSFDDSEIISYAWTQLAGTTVELSDPTSPVVTFTAPSFVNITDSEELIFQLEVIDNLEQSGTVEVFVQIEPTIPSAFALIDDLFLQDRDPLAFYTELLDTGEIVILDPNGTGILASADGEQALDWDSDENTLFIDFSPYGGSLPYVEQRTVDIDGDTIDEVVTETDVTNSASLLLLEDGAGVDLVDVTTDETKTIFNVTDNVLVSEEPFGETYSSRVFSSGAQLPFVISDGETRLLKTNVSTNNPRLDAQPETVLDELTFDAAGTGFARFKNQPFTWFIEDDGHLVVEFADGESGEYFHLEEGVAGDLATTLYHYLDGSSRASAFFMYRDNLDFDELGLPAMHLWYLPVLLEDDTVYYQRRWRTLRPDGTGQLEIEAVDPATGIASINVVGAGICWGLSGVDDLEVTLSVDFGQRYPGSRTPTVSHCASLVNSQVITGALAGGINSLYDVLPETVLRYGEERNQLQIMGRTLVNDCGCDDPLQVSDHVAGVMESMPFDGNPGFAVNDDVIAIPGEPIVIDILANDIAGDAAIDPSSIIIELDPNGGTYTINPATGEITYTPDPVVFDDVIYYRFKDVNGNLSSLGTVTISVGTSGV